MSAPRPSTAAECSAVSTLVRSTSVSPIHRASVSIASDRSTAPKRLDKSSPCQPTDSFSLNEIWRSLLESMPEGLIVMTRSLNPVYWNGQAKVLCRRLTDGEDWLPALPAVITEACHRLLRDRAAPKAAFLMDYRTRTGHVLRIRVRWLPIPFTPDRAMHCVSEENSSQECHILVSLEDCSGVLQRELQVDQQKYDLTDREAQIWMLLRQEYTYQEIARMLQISLNTVKTHIKNVYAKRRSCLEQDKFWCYETL